MPRQYQVFFCGGGCLLRGKLIREGPRQRWWGDVSWRPLGYMKGHDKNDEGQPRVKLIRIIFKTCSDIWVFSDDRNVQRNVGQGVPGRTPQQRKMQNAKGIEIKLATTTCQILCRSLALYVLPVMDVMQIHDWIHDWNCKFMTGGLILINKPRGGASQNHICV